MTGKEIVDRAARDAEDRPGHRLVWVFVGLSLFGLVVLATAFFSYRAASTDEIRSLDDRADENAAVANQLADQVEGLGGVPVVDPPPAADDPDPDDPEIQEPEVQDPEQQDPETQDPERDDPSIPGRDGANGADGPAPPCMSEPAQCRGADGANGRDGADGKDGPPGPSCPDGYSPSSRTYDPTPGPLASGDEETWWVCVADGGQG